MPATITIQTRNNGAVAAATVWQGRHLAVHRPITGDGSFSTEPRHWAITHHPTGFSACVSFDGSKARAIAVAKLWDAAFAPITEAGNAHGWPLAQAWQRDLRIAQFESYAEPQGPAVPADPIAQLAAARSPQAIEKAVWAAMGYEAATDTEAAEQYPAEPTQRQAGAGAIRRNPDSGLLELCWLPQGGNYPFREATELAGWYEIPTLGDVESWCLGSTAETPCGDTVEPDHPDAWPRLLGLI